MVHLSEHFSKHQMLYWTLNVSVTYNPGQKKKEGKKE